MDITEMIVPTVLKTIIDTTDITVEAVMNTTDITVIKVVMGAMDILVVDVILNFIVNKTIMTSASAKYDKYYSQLCNYGY
jgi:hypothetical protein